jgi:cellulose 1,4-beta-cellobiosidase
VGTTKNCYDGNTWDKTICPDDVTCAKNCALDGADYEGTYGVTTSGNALTLKFVTHGAYSKNIGSRSYLMDSTSTYRMFKLKNQEFSFTVDVSNLPCGLNGALYFVAMDEDGGKGSFPNNNAGAEYGTGYCDAQCPHDMKFISGEANAEGWKPSPSDPNAGTGKYGSCCDEFDIWEANQISSAYTSHSCSKDGAYRCEGTECGDDSAGERHKGVCDKDGCDLNPFRVGNKNFFGPGDKFSVDTSKPFQVVTQFLTADNTTTGELVEVRRLYVQDEKVVQTPMFTAGGNSYDSLTTKSCDAMKQDFGDINDFDRTGGFAKMAKSLEKGMVLVMSMWDDHDAHMLWLDSSYPTDKDPSSPGVGRGTCPTSSGVPADVERDHADATVVYSDIKSGDIGSTYKGGSGPSPGPTPGNCPGGTLSACIDLCPANPPAAYKACVQSCVERCS